MPLKVNKILTRPDVSRETEERLKEYYQILQTWNQSASLMKSPSWEEFYQRHILDGLYLSKCITGNNTIIDIGSGAGVPAIIISILGHPITLVESCRKKCIFLRYVSKTLLLDCKIKQERIENIRAKESDIITARALTSLSSLMEYMLLMSTNPTGVFLKGDKLEHEIKEAEEIFNFSYNIYGKENETGYIIKVWDIQRKDKVCV